MATKSLSNGMGSWFSKQFACTLLFIGKTSNSTTQPLKNALLDGVQMAASCAECASNEVVPRNVKPFLLMYHVGLVLKS